MLDHIRQGSGEPLVLAHGIHPQMWSRRMRADDAIRATHDLGDAPGVDAVRPRVIGFDRTHGDLGAPATIGRGTRDMLLIPRQARRARRRMPRARHVRLRGCGHVPAWDDPQQIADVVLPRARDA